MASAGESSHQSNVVITLTDSEQKRLDQLDSQFGYINLQTNDFAASNDRLLLCKALRMLENRLLKSRSSAIGAAETSSTDATKNNAEDVDDVSSSDKEVEHYTTYLRLGHIHLLANDFAKALSAYQKAYLLNKDGCWKDPCCYYGLGLVYFHFRAYQFAADAFNQLLYSSPLFERANEVHLRLGLIYKALEDFQLAIKHLNSALIDSRPCTLGKAEIRFHIAHCYDSDSDLPRAYHEYTHLLRDGGQLSNQVKAAVFRQIAWICYRTECDSESARYDKLNEAVHNLNESLKYEPNSGKSFYYLGRCFGALPGRAHDAFVNYRQSIDKSEADADTWCSIGVLYQQQNQPMDALQAYVCAVQLDARHSAAWTDLGLLYESHLQFDDALTCFRNAVKHRPAAPEALKARIQVLERELKNAPSSAANHKPPANRPQLPNLEKAWKLPIPAELTQRQEEFLHQKYQRYKDGSPLWSMNSLGTGLDTNLPNDKPAYYLSPQQIQMMQLLQQNQARLDQEQLNILQHMQHKYAAMQNDLRAAEIRRLQSSSSSAVVMAPNDEQKILSSGAIESTTSIEHGELPLVSQDDIINILGGVGNNNPTASTLPSSTATAASVVTKSAVAAMTKRRNSSVDDDLMAGLGDNVLHGAKDDSDPMLSSAAMLSKDASRDSTQCSDDVKPSSHNHRVQSQSEAHSSLIDEPATNAESATADLQVPLPPSFSLQSKVHVPSTCSSLELLHLCKKRCENPRQFTPIFDERVRPPMPPNPPATKQPKDKLLLLTPLVLIDNRKDAISAELQQFCYNSPVTLIRGLTAALKMDLSLFSTKSLIETAPDHQVEIRSQYRMPPETNVNHLGEPTWQFESNRSFSTVAKYAQYQAQSFQHSLKEEQEKLRSGAKNGDYEPFGKRRRTGTTAATDRLNMMPMRMLKFGTNVDLSDENKFRNQLMELTKVPAFCRLVSSCNVLTHLGHTVLGMNTVQLYMKVPGSRTPGHQENNWFAGVNINIGPGECEWFGVPSEYWGVIYDMCKKRGINYLKGSWWPNLDDLYAADVPVYRFTQRAGDMVWVGSGCVHWVQATGWCNNVAWNVGPTTVQQIDASLQSHEFNRLLNYKSLVPLQHLCWQLSKNVRFTNEAMFESVKRMLIRSFAYARMIADFVEISCGKQLKQHLRTKGEVAHYCNACEIEVFNILFVLEQGGKFTVYCVDCARKVDAQLTPFVVLQQISFDELARDLDACQLHPQKQGVIC